MAPLPISAYPGMIRVIEKAAHFPEEAGILKGLMRWLSRSRRCLTRTGVLSAVIDDACLELEVRIVPTDPDRGIFLRILDTKGKSERAGQIFGKYMSRYSERLTKETQQ